MLYSLQSLEIYLHKPGNPQSLLLIGDVQSDWLRGVFYNELRQRHAELASHMHNDKGIKPFSLAPLFKDGLFLGFRAGVLSADFGHVIESLWNDIADKCTKGRKVVYLGKQPMVVSKVKPGYPQAMTYEQLLTTTSAAHGLRLRFETPMRLKTFGQSGVLPVPYAVWQSYAQRWEKYSDIPLPPELVRWVGARVQSTDLALETCYAYIEKSVEWKGVMGEIEYQAFTDDDRDVPSSRIPDYLRAWQALALLAEFCGTGEKATMGMGRTRRVKTFGEHRDKTKT